MNNEEQQYLDTLEDIINNGIDSDDRTGVGTKYTFAKRFDYDISNGKIPIWTTRKVPWKNQVWELIWFIRGDTNIKFLKDRGVNIWDSWCDEYGNVGPIYSEQLRKWRTSDVNDIACTGNSVYEYTADHYIDQLQILIDGIKNNPESRRHIITLWNPGIHNTLPKPYLPPCHSNHTQIVINPKTKDLYYHSLMRSADLTIGYCPWQHALFANIIGKLTGYKPKQLSMTLINCHVYNNHHDSVLEQLKRTSTDFPVLKMNENINTIEDVENSVLEDYELIGYNPQSFLKFPIAV